MFNLDVGLSEFVDRLSEFVVWLRELVVRLNVVEA